MAAQPLIGLDIFDFFLWNRWTDFDEIWQEAKSQHPLPSFFFRSIRKQDGSPSLWLAKTFLTSPLKLLNRILWNLTDRKNSMYSTKFVFFRWSDKQDHHQWVPRPLIGLENFDFSSETAERNLTKLDRKQDLNILYQVCVFGLLEIHVKMAASASKLADTFLTSAQKPLNGIQRNLTESNISKFTTKFVFFGPIRKPRWPPRPLIGQDIFDFSSETAEWNSMKLDRKHDLNVLYQVGSFLGRSENQDGHQGQSVNKGGTLYSSGNSRWPPKLWLAETFSNLKPLNAI